MSAIAEILHKKGHFVSGSDSTEKNSTNHLKNLGIEVFIGHSEENVKSPDIVVYTSAIPNDNPELKKAKEKCPKCMVRSQMLGSIMSSFNHKIAVSGVHGKTTTTTLVDSILSKAGNDLTSMIGTAVKEFGGGNARMGKGNDIFLTEACEAFESFLDLYPSIAIITNIDADHLDYYGSIEKIEEAFKKFCVENLDVDGTIIFCNDNKRLRKIVKESNKKAVSFGINENADFKAQNIKTYTNYITFDVYSFGKFWSNFRINMYGTHNVLNSLAAIACANQFGVEKDIIKKALENFIMPRRRFNILYNKDIMIVDDYAHHPTEIKSTLEALRNHHPERKVIAVFQPHLYSRTQFHLNEFVKSLSIADEVIVTDIYAAREQPIKGITGEMVNKKIQDKYGKEKAIYMPKDKICKYLLEISEKGHIIIILGAGDINSVCNEMCEHYK